MFSVELRYRARKIYRSVKQIVELVSNVLLFLASFLAIILVIYRFGFDMPADYSHEIYYTYRAIIRLFVVLGLLRFLFNFRLLRAESLSFQSRTDSDVWRGITIEYHTTFETAICCPTKSGKSGSSFCREFFVHHLVRGSLTEIT